MADTIITATVGTGTLYQTGGTGNVYYFNGAQPTDFKFPWVAGAVLRVDQSNATNDGHPFLFTTSASTNTATMRAGIITNNVEGSLVVPNDIDSFTTSIEQMILSEVKRNEFSNNAFIRSHDFLKNKVMLQWDVLFNNISNS